MIYETKNNCLVNLSDMKGIYIEQRGEEYQVVINWTLKAVPVDDNAIQAIYTSQEGWKAVKAYECIRDAYKLGHTLISHAEIEAQMDRDDLTVYAMTSTSTQGEA